MDGRLKTEKWKRAKWYRILTAGVFPALLFLYPLRHVAYGVEWWDTGYNYANFTYPDRVDSMWNFSTYLAGAAGHLLTRLPFGDRMMGLNFYTGLTVSALALGGYFFFTRKIKIPPVIVFLGEAAAVGLCWCPTALLYNYLTYLLLFAAAVCLYVALTEEKKPFFVLAGICLGLNVFVRFSNLAQAALILAVWAFAFIRRKKCKETLSWTGWCLLGYALGFGGFFAYLCARYGAGAYLEAIGRLFGMTRDATEYTAVSMVTAQLRNYLQNLIWLAKMLPFVLLGALGFAVLPGRFEKIKKIGFVCCMGLVFYWLMNRNMFNFKYSTKLSVFQWGVCLLTFLMIAGTVVIFDRRSSDGDKLLCGLSMLIAAITPLGSNNHLYSSINNLFFLAPVILWILWKRLKALPAVWRPGAGRWKVSLYSYPFRAAICMILAMLLIQSVGFGFGYVFSESDGGENLHTKIENSDILKGMYTDAERARQLGELLAFTGENGLAGKEIILYGGIPALSYYLEMPFAITAWPDLPSYNFEVMEADLARLQSGMEQGREAPVVLLEAAYGAYREEGGEALRALLSGDNDKTERIAEDGKFALLREFMDGHGYTLAFANDKFMLFWAR